MFFTSLARILSAVGREALESSSPGLQPGAKPSQLPTQRKRPDVLATPGLLSRALQSEDSPVSQAHGIQRERIRRLIGEARCTFAFGGTGPYERHGRFSACLKYLVDRGSKRAAVLHTTPQDPERFRRVRKIIFIPTARGVRY